MRIDLPICGFSECKYRLDGNCTKRQDECEFFLRGQLLEAAVEELENCHGREVEISKRIKELIN